jgi:hypothetical protein
MSNKLSWSELKSDSGLEKGTNYNNVRFSGLVIDLRKKPDNLVFKVDDTMQFPELKVDLRDKSGDTNYIPETNDDEYIQPEQVYATTKPVDTTEIPNSKFNIQNKI